MGKYEIGANLFKSDLLKSHFEKYSVNRIIKLLGTCHFSPHRIQPRRSMLGPFFHVASPTKGISSWLQIKQMLRKLSFHQEVSLNAPVLYPWKYRRIGKESRWYLPNNQSRSRLQGRLRRGGARNTLGRQDFDSGKDNWLHEEWMRRRSFANDYTPGFRMFWSKSEEYKG